MSFAGHVFDMIRRNKEDRENLRRMREQTAGNDRSRYTSHIPDISVEEFERIRQQTRLRERQERRSYNRMVFWMLAIAGVLLLILGGLKLFVW